MTALLEEKLDTSEIAEVHWSTNTILAVFFAASLISAVFFGLGYSFGRGGSAKPALDTVSSDNASPTDSMPQQAASSKILRNGTISSTARPSPSVDVHRSANGQLPPPATLRQISHVSEPRAIAATPRETRPVPAAAQEHSTVKRVEAATAGVGRYMVQVGAVGDRKDAQMLVSQLRKRGFRAGIYSARQDSFLHVQIGPFADIQQAQTVRHRVMASGYHAILKRAS